MDEEIKKEIETLRLQARNDERTGYHDLAKHRRKLALWLEELLRYRKQQLDLKKSIDQYNKATCRITPECKMCDAWCEEGRYCELSLEEEKRKSKCR